MSKDHSKDCCCAHRLVSIGNSQGSVPREGSRGHPRRESPRTEYWSRLPGEQVQGKDQGRHGGGPVSAVGNDFLLILPRRCLVPLGCPGVGAVPSSLHQRFFSAPPQALMGSSQASGVPGDLFSAQRDSDCLFSDSELKWGPQLSLT